MKVLIKRKVTTIQPFINLEHTQEFLETNGWVRGQEGRVFVSYFPPAGLDLPDDYYIDVPKSEGKGFEKYMNQLIDVLEDIYDGRYTRADFETFFSTENNILGVRIIDKDTENGSIGLSRLKAAISSTHKIIKQSVIFAVSEVPIFGSAKNESRDFLSLCRAKQTQHGSYVVKFELPNHLLTLFQKNNVANLLFETIEFLSFISASCEEEDINQDFIDTNKDSLNVELLEAVLMLYKESNFNEVQFILGSNTKNKTHNIGNVRGQLPRMQLLVNSIKKHIIEQVPLEIEGKVLYLKSSNVENGGKIKVETFVSDEKSSVDVQLLSEDYKKAVIAHRTELNVKIKGIAKPLNAKNRYSIENVDYFEVMPNNR